MPALFLKTNRVQCMKYKIAVSGMAGSHFTLGQPSQLGQYHTTARDVRGKQQGRGLQNVCPGHRVSFG